MKNWDKILKDFSHKCKGGAPDFTNSDHLKFLRESLIKMGWNESAANAFLGNLREAKAEVVGKTLKQAKAQAKDGQTYSSEKSKKVYTKGQEEKGDEGGETNTTQHATAEEEQQMVTDAQQETSDLRDKGEAGAGGQSASQGESRYCSRLNEGKTTQERKEKDEQWEKDNSTKISEEEKAIDDRRFYNRTTRSYDSPTRRRVAEDGIYNTKLSDEEKEVLDALGLEEECVDTGETKKLTGTKGKVPIYDCTIPDEMKNYLAKREVWAKQELERMRNMPEPNVLMNSDGFGGNEEAYLEWMRAAYDGGVATEQILEDSRLDTSKPHTTVQSTPEVDNKVRGELEKKTKEACKVEDSDDCKYYKKQLKDWDKFSKYHDTFTLGVDEKGRTFVVHISNKKGSNLKDPQNNTTPAQRLVMLKGKFKPPVPQNVDRTITTGLQRVSDAQMASRRSQADMTIDDDFVDFFENHPDMEARRAKLDDQGRSDNERSEFSKWVRAQGGKKWEEMTTREKLEAMQNYTKSRLETEDGKSRLMTPEEAVEKFGKNPEDKPDNWVGDWPPPAEETDNKGKVKRITYYLNDEGEWVKATHHQVKLPYDPFGRIITKTGELNKSRDVDENSSIGQAKRAKEAEADAVVSTHREVVKSLHDADRDVGDFYHPDDPDSVDKPNGPTTQGYIETTLQAMHFDSYIDLDDEDDDKMIIQMGINGARPSDIRNCLAELSGFKGNTNPLDKEALKKHLRERCRVDTSTNPPAVVIVDSEGKGHSLIEDVWRTAGTAQKVASHFGSGMRDCVKGKANNRVDLK